MKSALKRLTSLIEFTPVTGQLLNMIAEQEKVDVSDMVEDISDKNPSEIKLFDGVTIFILVYLSYSIKDRVTEAFDTAMHVLKASNVETVDLLRRVFADEGVSLPILHLELQPVTIKDADGLRQFLKSLLARSYSGKH